MYANIRMQSVPRTFILGALILAFAAGGGAGYTLRTVSIPTGASSGDVRDAGEANAAFRAEEHQGSAENPNALAGPNNVPFLHSEHTGSPENPVR